MVEFSAIFQRSGMQLRAHRARDEIGDEFAAIRSHWQGGCIVEGRNNCGMHAASGAKNMTNLRATLMTAAVVIAFATPASADLVFDSTIFVTGQGFGNVPRDLTVQRTGGTTSPESGCVGISGGNLTFGGSACLANETNVLSGNGTVNTGGHEPSPLADNQKYGAPSLASLNITDPSMLGILFNATEPSGNAVTLNDLTLKIFNGDTLVKAFDTDQTYNFADSDVGNGSAGRVFVFDDAQQTWLLNNIFNQLGYGNFRLALEATLSDTSGGPESFVILNVGCRSDRCDVTEIPVPGVLGLLGAGLMGLGIAARRRRKN